MHVFGRAVVWTFLVSAGLAPLYACGDDRDGERPDVMESKIPPEKIRPPTEKSAIPTPRTGAGASLVPSVKPDDGTEGELETPRTGAAGGLTPMEKPTGRAAPAERRGIETRTITIQANGVEIFGTLTQPAAGDGNLLVLMLHGYTGTQSEFRIPSTGEGLFERAARRFAEAGITSFRFDFAGSGQSGGAWKDTTFTGQSGDTRAVIAALRDRHGFGSMPLAILGFSQGGLVALKTAAKGAAVSRIALWNPVLDPKKTYSRILGADQVRNGWQLAQAGETDKVVGTTRLAAGFFRDVYKTRPVEDAAAYSGPMLIVSGSRDSVAAAGPTLAREVQTARGSLPTELVVIPADHVFGAQQGTGRIDKAIDATIAFLLAGG